MNLFEMKVESPITPNENYNLKTDVWTELNQITHYLRYFSKQLSGNEFDADDLYQETVLLIIKKAEKYTPGTNFKAWATTIMRNVFINSYRRKKRFKAVLDQKPVDHFSNERNIDNTGESKMVYDELLQMINKLPENFRRPFLLAYKGFSYKEIAEIINAPMGTIKSRIFFARRTLQSMVGECL